MDFIITGSMRTLRTLVTGSRFCLLILTGTHQSCMIPVGTGTGTLGTEFY